MSRNTQQAAIGRLFEDPQQATWSRRRVRPGMKTCGRDPEAGPGTCKLWWEGCPNAEKKNCYQRWWRQQNGLKP